MKILIGHVEHTNRSGVEQCGGVVERLIKVNLVVSLANMSRGKKLMIKWKRMMKEEK